MSATSIEWTDATWNPTTGCTRASAGCDHCYAFTMTKRLAAMGQEKYQGLTGNGHFNGVLKTWDDELEKPLRWRKPRMVFVNSMSDLFHKDVPFEFIDKVFGVMIHADKHTYQILTKRPERMAEYFETRKPERPGLDTVPPQWLEWINHQPDDFTNNIVTRFTACSREETQYAGSPWPQPNIWLGTSVENQQAADERILHLLRCPAAVRFLSCEPLLGPIDITWGLDHPERTAVSQLQWVIVGGESGPKARPMHPDWARAIRDQCELAGVSFFFKQWGEHVRGDQMPHTAEMELMEIDESAMYRVGKKAAGRTLDGREWSEFPTDNGNKFAVINCRSDRDAGSGTSLVN